MRRIIVRGHINPYMFGFPEEPQFVFCHQFKNIAEIKQYLINHIKKLKNDIQWSKTSCFGFFVNTELKNEKINGLLKILNAFVTNTIDAKNYAEFLKNIETQYQQLHNGYYFSNESHKIIEGIKKYFASNYANHDKKETYQIFK